MRIVHRQWKKHLNANALSRDIPDSCLSYSTKVRLEDFPCGGCRYCQRAHERWNDFNTEVDDVIPLAQLFQESPVHAEDDPESRDINLQILDPALREIIVTSAWEHFS